MAKQLKEHPKGKHALPLADSTRDVRINYAPPHFPDQSIIDYILLNHGLIEKSYRMKNICRIHTRTRIYKLLRKNLETKPKPSYLYFGKYNFSVKYEGQDHTCAYCVETGHAEKDCPKKNDIKTFRTGNLLKIQTEQPTPKQDSN